MEISPLVTKCHPHLIGIPFLFKVLKVIAKCGEREWLACDSFKVYVPHAFIDKSTKHRKNTVTMLLRLSSMHPYDVTYASRTFCIYLYQSR